MAHRETKKRGGGEKKARASRERIKTRQRGAVRHLKASSGLRDFGTDVINVTANTILRRRACCQMRHEVILRRIPCIPVEPLAHLSPLSLWNRHLVRRQMGRP